MPSLRRHEGYLLIDHSASPGSRAVPEGKKFEAPALVCCHCATIVILEPARTRDRGYCQKCDHYVCDSPGCNAECNPIARTAELAVKMPDSNLQFMLRGPRGELLFDPALLDKTRIY